MCIRDSLLREFVNIRSKQLLTVTCHMPNHLFEQNFSLNVKVRFALVQDLGQDKIPSFIGNQLIFVYSIGALFQPGPSLKLLLEHPAVLIRWMSSHHPPYSQFFEPRLKVFPTFLPSHLGGLSFSPWFCSHPRFHWD